MCSLRETVCIETVRCEFSEKGDSQALQITPEVTDEETPGFLKMDFVSPRFRQNGRPANLRIEKTYGGRLGTRTPDLFRVKEAL